MKFTVLALICTVISLVHLVSVLGRPYEKWELFMVGQGLIVKPGYVNELRDVEIPILERTIEQV